MCDCVCRSRTAEQGLVASVRGGQWAQPLQPLVQHSAQMARVAEAADSHAVQVHRLNEVAQQRPLQAEDVPSEGRESGRKWYHDVKVDKGGKVGEGERGGRKRRKKATVGGGT